MHKFLWTMGILISFYTLSPVPCALANNIRVENVALYESPGQPEGTIDIKFDVKWDNSFSGTEFKVL